MGGGLRIIYRVARHTNAQVQSRESREGGGAGALEGQGLERTTSATHYVKMK